MRKYLYRSTTFEFPFWTLAGDRIHLVRNEPGIVSWSVSMYCLGRCLALITCRPWIVRFRSRKVESGVALRMGLGWWGVSVFLGNARAEYMESIAHMIVEVKRG